MCKGFIFSLVTPPNEKWVTIYTKVGTPLYRRVDKDQQSGWARGFPLKLSFPIFIFSSDPCYTIHVGRFGAHTDYAKGFAFFITWSISTAPGRQHTELTIATHNNQPVLPTSLTDPPLNPTFRAQINVCSSQGCSSLPTAGLWHFYSMSSRHDHFLAGIIDIDVSPLRTEPCLPPPQPARHTDTAHRSGLFGPQNKLTFFKLIVTI